MECSRLMTITRVLLFQDFFTLCWLPFLSHEQGEGQSTSG